MTHIPPAVNFTGIDSLLIYTNTLADGWTMAIFLGVMHIVFLSFMIRRGNDTLESFVASTYVMGIAAAFMFALGIIPTEVITLYVVLAGLSLFAFIARKKE